LNEAGEARRVEAELLFDGQTQAETIHPKSTKMGFDSVYDYDAEGAHDEGRGAAESEIEKDRPQQRQRQARREAEEARGTGTGTNKTERHARHEAEEARGTGTGTNKTERHARHEAEREADLTEAAQTNIEPAPQEKDQRRRRLQTMERLLREIQLS